MCGSGTWSWDAFTSVYVPTYLTYQHRPVPQVPEFPMALASDD
jgi:hypothetical protein